MDPDLVYLDHAATTAPRRVALDEMRPWAESQFGNPSGSHRAARIARRAVDEARDRVADVIGVTSGEVVFTSCGTESDNFAIAGTVAAVGGTAVCSAAEHHAVLDPVTHLGGVVVHVGSDGAVDLDALAGSLQGVSDRGGRVSVVSVMAVNNEVGTVTDLAAVADVVRRLAPDAWLHTDAVQAACWLDLGAISAVVDMMSLSAHKFGGPKGMGVLMVRDGVNPHPLLLGGGQERGRRSGTTDVAGVVGTAAALVAADAERDHEVARVGALRDRLIDGITSAVEIAVETVPRASTVPGVAHLCFPGIENEALLFLLDQDGLCASAASACASGAMEPSHVLAAMGVDRRTATGALRLSLGHTTTVDDIESAISIISAAVARLVDIAGRSRVDG
jgi:cysteine desulfurase